VLQTTLNLKIKWLIFIAILVSSLSLFYDAVYSDAVVYAVIAKHIVQHNDWINLVYWGADWLDKPHFPFWITAASFKLLGINSVAYLIPGFIFHLIGAYFTYRLALYLYDDQVGLIACLIYLTTLRLLIGVGDLRAEAYLLGEIIPACYFWLRYEKETRLKYLIAGAFFTALALMTKGLIVLTVIGGGFLFKWIYERNATVMTEFKWYAAIALTLVFITPELIALYLQFDAHPEKIIFGHTHVSGIRFFFWDSQFGRFFNFGPIQNTNGNIFFFAHTFLWAFLPWSILFICAAIRGIKNPFLWGAFVLPVILFSLTKFQLDHYIDIIFPFAAIICAYYFAQIIQNKFAARKIMGLQIFIAFLVILFGLGLFYLALEKNIFSWAFIVALLPILYMIRLRKESLACRAIVYSALSILMLFVFFAVMNRALYLQHDVGYKLAKILNQQPTGSVYSYQSRWTSFEFNNHMPYFAIDDFQQINPNEKMFYIAANENKWPDIHQAFPQAQLIAKEEGLASNVFAARLLSHTKRFPVAADQHVIIVKINQPIPSPAPMPPQPLPQ
jgi:4-amino-4-deoxy-L-arabinose transferase-like glycosyltransferase